ncbi:marine proteobacterial sortase target protein [Colwellia sp. MB02u-11]|uniref:marine proteobacterial sortase target protein n=1 Tax=Colwellia sp. MB02u-11 TaxID=2759816 RepID=UPI0015F5B817|nr:marine proteobacterial sortase target protein [Colwellia sp. MB02u-11]MBA6237578.1 marine proteobacterial sortase target protein [Colwellia sp. MB02u-11]
MFSSKKSLKFVDYQDSYYYRQQRKKRRNKWLKISLILLLIGFFALFFIPFAQSNNMDMDKMIANDNSLIEGPQLHFEHPNPTMRATFPVDIKADVEINGLVAHVTMQQTFINPHAITLEGAYQFPLPEGAAVKKLLISVGDKEIVGKIMEKETARAVYKKAKTKGKKASLVEQHRPNLFMNKIANIPAQSTVVVTLTFIIPVSYHQNKFNFRLPLAITKRYQPLSYHQITDGPKKNPTTSSTTSSTLHYPPIARSQSSITIKLTAGVAITSIFSASHQITMRPLNSDQNGFYITLKKAPVVSNKSFTLSWQLLPSVQAQVSSFSQEISGEHYTLLTFFPPKLDQAQVIARDIIFIIDTSGSMQGPSIEQAKASLKLAILQLNEKDSFNIIAFDDETQLLFPFTTMATEKNITTAQQFISELTADGGTEMYRPLSNALIMKKSAMQSAKAIRQIVFMTDGAVANEFELMQLLSNAQGNFRLYTVGIGGAPNGYFMKKAAQFGRGSYVFIQNNKEIEVKMSAFMKKISRPAITNIELILDNQVHQYVEVYPKKIPDLYFGEPLQVALKSQFPMTSIQLSGNTASAPWYQQLIINSQQSFKGTSTLWARRKIESLLDSLVSGANSQQVKSAVISTSLDHQIISPYTSFIAVEKQPQTTLLLAKKSLSAIEKAKYSVIQAHESLRVAMPQTAIGWQLQFMLGLSILLLVILYDFTWLASKRFKWRFRRAKHH